MKRHTKIGLLNRPRKELIKTILSNEKRIARLEKTIEDNYRKIEELMLK